MTAQPVQQQDDVQGVDLESPLDGVWGAQAGIEAGAAGLLHRLGVEDPGHSLLGLWTEQTVKEHVGLDFARSAD